MYSGILFSLFLVLTTGCAGLPDEELAVTPAEVPREEELRSSFLAGAAGRLPSDLQSWPRDNRPVFIGYSNRLFDRAQETEAALRNAAEQVSRFELMTAIYQYVAQTDGRRTGSVDSVVTDWDESVVSDLIGTLEVLHSEQLHDGSIVLTTVDRTLRSPLRTLDSIPGTGSQPGWVGQPPEIPGYIVGVGVAQRRRTMAESLAAADERALVDILLQTNATIRLLEESRTRERSTQTLTTVAQEATATLGGFLVLARHVSSDGRTFYSLAVAQEMP
ncbi:MAG: hypothetical protein EA383_06650 [Spirochaetaceae bacterium]|nr:MAG: hypothetical protein EA383_06650 [Spirochaetaceae bacterium]